MHPLAEKMLRKSALPNIFCAGCGHGTVLNSYLRAVDQLGIFKEITHVGGIGCSGWTPVFIDTDTIHTLHGRALAVATGLKLANPKRKVVVFTGDGDCTAIGGNHFLHAARRNIDLTVIMMNNEIYGMTGGQVAPTTPGGARTQTSPYGNLEPTIDACKLAVCAGATYVGRWTVAQPGQLVKALREAIMHKGFAFIETVVQCPTQAGRYMHGTASATDLYNMLKKNTVKAEKAKKLSSNELAGKIVAGKLHEDISQPEYAETIYGLMKSVEQP
jgi:2-oxoglutarate ferredoxin oxidoreductase subunit beta